MSLNSEERTRTGRELRQAAAGCGVGEERIAADLGWSPARLRSTLAVDAASDPTDVWELRDYLVETTTGLTREPAVFTVLTASARLRAERWFPLRRPPRHVPHA